MRWVFNVSSNQVQRSYQLANKNPDTQPVREETHVEDADRSCAQLSTAPVCILNSMPLLAGRAGM